MTDEEVVTLKKSTLDYTIAEIREVHALVNARIPPGPGSVAQRVAELCEVFDLLVEQGLDDSDVIDNEFQRIH